MLPVARSAHASEAKLPRLASDLPDEARLAIVLLLPHHVDLGMRLRMACRRLRREDGQVDAITQYRVDSAAALGGAVEVVQLHPGEHLHGAIGDGGPDGARHM